MSRLWSLFLFTGFLALLLLPSIEQQTGLIPVPALDENRNKLAKPYGEVPEGSLLERIYRGGQSYSNAFERYYNDHYGFRDFLIRLKNQMDLSLFSHSDSVLLGKDGYLFFREQVERDLVKADRIPPETMEYILERIRDFAAWSKANGKTFAVVLCRDKETVYAEKLDRAPAKRPNVTAADIYSAKLASEPGIIFLDTKPILSAARQKQPVFYRTDFHWNSIGAFFTARDLVHRLAREMDKDLRWNYQLSVKEVPGYSGTQNLYLAVFSPEAEVALEVNRDWTARSQPAVPPPFPFEEHWERKDNAAARLFPPTVIIGNSFTPYLFKTPFPEYFERVSYAFKGYLQYASLAQLVPADVKIVVLQVNEFDLGTFYTNPELWKNIPKRDRSRS